MARTVVPDVEQRRALVELAGTMSVTVDGHRATVGGWRNDFATVHDLKTGAAWSWSWQAVERVLKSSGGAFKS